MSWWFSVISWKNNVAERVMRKKWTIFTWKVMRDFCVADKTHRLWNSWLSFWVLNFLNIGYEAWWTISKTESICLVPFLVGKVSKFSIYYSIAIANVSTIVRFSLMNFQNSSLFIWNVFFLNAKILRRYVKMANTERHLKEKDFPNFGNSSEWISRWHCLWNSANCNRG